jgi:hypothetical protein
MVLRELHPRELHPDGAPPSKRHSSSLKTFHLVWMQKKNSAPNRLQKKKRKP